MNEMLALGSMAAGLVAMVAILGLAVYIYTALALMTIARKTNTTYGWMAWIPILNLVLMVRIAKLPWWTFIGFLLSIIPVVGWLLTLLFTVYVWWKIAEVRGFPGWFSILFLVPLVNLIIIGVLAWSEGEGKKKPITSQKTQDVKVVKETKPKKKTTRKSKKKSTRKKTAKTAKKKR